MKLTKYSQQCGMSNECKNHPMHIDIKGFLYCSDCALRRKQTHSCRKLSSHEIKELHTGKVLSRFNLK